MKYEIKNFETKDNKKFVGFFVKDDKGAILAIDKYLPLVDGKSNEDYVKDAIELCKSEVDDWQGSYSFVGKTWNPETNSFE